MRDDNEYVRTVENALVRHHRLLFLDAAAAHTAAPAVAEVLAQETDVDPQLAAFEALVRQYAAPA